MTLEVEELSVGVTMCLVFVMKYCKWIFYASAKEDASKSSTNQLFRVLADKLI